MPSGPYERFYPGEDRGLLDPTWGGGPYRLNAPSISQVEPWHVGAALGVSAVPGLIGLGEAAVPSLLRGAQLVNRGLTTAGSKVDDIIKTATGPLQSPSRRKALKDIAVATGKVLVDTSPLWSLPLKDLSVPSSTSSFPAINTLKASVVPMLKKTLQSATDDDRDYHWSEPGATDVSMAENDEERRVIMDSNKIGRSWEDLHGKVTTKGLPDEAIYYDETDEEISQKELRTLGMLWHELAARDIIPRAFPAYEEGKHPPLLGLPENERAGEGPLGGKELQELKARSSVRTDWMPEGIDKKKYPDYVGSSGRGRAHHEIYGLFHHANDVAIALEWHGKRNPKLLLEAIDSVLKSGNLRWGWPTTSPTEQDETSVYFLERLRNEIVRENKDKLTDFIDAGLIAADWYLGK